NLIVAQLLDGWRSHGTSAGWDRPALGFGFGFPHQNHRGEDFADFLGVVGVTKYKLFYRRALPLTKRFDEFVGNLPERIGRRKVVIDHGRFSSLPFGVFASNLINSFASRYASQTIMSS